MPLPFKFERFLFHKTTPSPYFAGRATCERARVRVRSCAHNQSKRKTEKHIVPITRLHAHTHTHSRPYFNRGADGSTNKSISLPFHIAPQARFHDIHSHKQSDGGALWSRYLPQHADQIKLGLHTNMALTLTRTQTVGNKTRHTHTHHCVCVLPELRRR